MRCFGLSLVVFCLLLVPSPIFLFGDPPADQKSVDPTRATERIQERVLAWIDYADAHVDDLTPAAEATADRLLRGGHLWAMGNGGFADEMFFRIGGLPFLHVWTTDPETHQHYQPQDVFLYGQFVPNEPVETHDRLITVLAGGRFHGSTAVIFSSKLWPQVAHLLEAAPPERLKGRVFFIDTHAPAGNSIADLCVSEIATTAMAWAYQGEVLAAATRRGKTLATYASPFEKDYKQSDESVKDMIVNPDFHIPPIPAGTLAHNYFKHLREEISPFALSQANTVREAAQRIVQCGQQGGIVWALNRGHIHQRGSTAPGDLPIMVVGRDYEWHDFAPRVPKTDLVFVLASVEFPEKIIKPAIDRGCPVIEVSSDQRASTPEVMHIRCFIGPQDACVDLPEYPLKVLPTSGIVQAVIWHSVMAEAEELLKSSVSAATNP